MFEMNPVAVIRNDFDEKFGIPRQSGMLNEMKSVIEFAPEYRSMDAVRGMEGYSHLWLIWVFDKNNPSGKKLTVRPPRLGGNTRMGVFATRSPFRPNPIGLSCVRLEEIRKNEKGEPVLIVSGADLCSGTPILDIKPYVPYSDSHPDALSGFSVNEEGHVLAVRCDEELLSGLPEEKRATLLRLLSYDPRPAYQSDDREYGITFAGMNIRFSVKNGTLTVLSAAPV